jgi:hypothetical protein
LIIVVVRFVDGKKPLKMEWSQKLIGNHLISGIAPSKFKENEIEKLVEGMLERKTLLGKPVEYVASKATVWMPYYEIWIEYWRSRNEAERKTGERMLADTALNAMFCGCVRSEIELLMIFRPNYLRHEAVSIVPSGDEIVGPTSKVDFNCVLSSLVNKLNEVQDELAGLKSALSKSYVRKRRFSMLLPMGSLREEKELSAKIAKLDALRNTINMCLNIDGEVGAIEVSSDGTFYYPTAIFLLKNRENENQRFLVVNLVKKSGILQRPKCDISLTQLCNSNDECRELVTAAVASSSLPC